MTKEVVCSKGRCEYTEPEYDVLSACNNCSITEQIEHDLLLEQLDWFLFFILIKYVVLLHA